MKKLFARNKDASNDQAFEELRNKFKLLRKNVDSIQENLKKNQKYVEGITKPLNDLAASINTFYTDNGSPDRGKRISKTVSVLTQAVEEYNREYESLQAILNSLSDQLTQLRKDIAERDRLYEDYQAKSKSYNTAQSKENDPAKLQQLKDKFQAAKDAFHEADEKLIVKLTATVEKSTDDFEPIYKKLMMMYTKLFKSFNTAFAEGFDDHEPSSLSSSLQSSNGIVSSEESERKRSQSALPPPPPRRNQDTPAPSSTTSDTSRPPLPSRPLPSVPATATPSSAPSSAPQLPPRTSSPEAPMSSPPLPPRGVSNGPPSEPLPQPPARVPPSSPSPSLSTSAPPLPARSGTPPTTINTNQAPPLPSRTPASQSPTTTTNGPPALPIRNRAATVAVTSTGSEFMSNGPPPLPNREPKSPSPAPTGPSSTPPSLPPRSPNQNASQPPLPSRPHADSANTSPVLPFSSIPEEEQKKYSLIFKREDPNNTGFITGQKAYTMFIRSGLSQHELAQIWEIADQDKDGSLNRGEFIVAMFLINGRLSGKIQVIPQSIPPSLNLKAHANMVSSSPPSLPPRQGNSPSLPPRNQGTPPPLPSRGSPALSSRSTVAATSFDSSSFTASPPALPPRGGGAPPPLPSRSAGSSTFESRGSTLSSHSSVYSTSSSDYYGSQDFRQRADAKVDNLAHEARQQTQRAAGQAVANAATNRENQQAVGSYIAERSDNPLVKSLATNSYVQKQAGKMVAEKAQDEEFQQKAGDMAIQGAKSGASYANKNKDGIVGTAKKLF